LLKLDPKHQHALELLRKVGCDHVRMLCRENRHRQAVGLLQGFIEADANHTPFYILLARAFLDQGKELEAEETLGRCIELAPNKPLAHAQVGRAYMSVEYFERAEAHFKEAGGLDTEDEDVLLTIGTAYLPHNTRRANRYLNKLIANQPEDPAVFERICNELIGEGQPELAQKILDRGVKAFPDSIPLWMHKIRVALMMEDIDLVRKTAKKLRKLAMAAGEFEILQAISALEMMLTFQSTWGNLFDDEGGFFDDEYDEFDDEPF
ncbi:MAG: hypothetical protein O7E52_18705, partial [Candidatus Poribacteria bacterium]|nr:hypothetical protein [Candidatus Poribacteria bacterium]